MKRKLKVQAPFTTIMISHSNSTEYDRFMTIYKA